MIRIAMLLLSLGTLTGLHAGTLPAGVIEGDLAGQTFSAHPWFEPVRSVDHVIKLYIGVDPHAFPSISGATCDSYVTADRDRAGWAADPSLVDLTPSGAATLSFPGGSLAANRFPIAGAGELDATTTSGWAVPYDLVLDCNQNGLLDAGDLLDGADGAGFYAIGNTSAPGPRTVATALYGAGNFQQIAYYPADLAAPELAPLVSISHGWLLNYQWYGHIGEHLASYGYVVMSHVNDVGNGDGPASETAAVSTLANIDFVLGDPGLGASFAAHVDGSRITLIGHSTGGEGVVRAYTRLRTGLTSPQNFDADDIVLVAPLCPVFFNGTTDPLDVPFHLFGGAADVDTSGAPYAGYVQLFSLYERATGPKQATYIHGAGHVDFDDGMLASGAWADGPDLIGREKTHPVVLGHLLPLLEWYVRGNPAGRDFVERRDARFGPGGADPGIRIVREFREALAADDFVIDDYQQQPATTVSSSGGTVAHTANLEEVLMRDFDSVLDWTGTQPSNGLTRGRFNNQSGLVFDWSPGETPYIEWEIVPAQRDWTDDGFLSFRATQGTRHPETVALDGTLTFTVTLRDGAGVESALDLATYGGIGTIYPRTGLGTGVGWSNEFSTVRLPLADFTADGRTLDLGDIVAVRFDFGGASGSERGRLALDDLILTGGNPPLPFLLEAAAAGETVTFSWPASPRASAFNVYRGTVPAGGLGSRTPDVYDHTCFDAGDAAGDGPFTASDATPVPLDVRGFYYLVTRETAQGEEGAGSASDGTPRPLSAPCP